MATASDRQHIVAWWPIVGLSSRNNGIDEMRCASCGHDNREAGQKFCGQCGRPLAAAAEPPPADSAPLPAAVAAGRYPVKRFLGEGTKKRVYLAHDTRLDRDVAIALLKTDSIDERSLERIRLEARAMARLGDHPRIVTVHDIGEEEGRPYIVSQYMAGGTVEHLLARSTDRRPPLELVIRIADQICQALEHAHARGIVHRDLKPSNVWLTDDGFAKLGDFGLALAIEGRSGTAEGTLLGTASYVSPEQALGKAVDGRSDLYSLGGILYEMATGRPPFVGGNAAAVISQHLTAEPEPPSRLRPGLPQELDRLVLALLSKAPDDRPESAAAVRELLRAIPTAAAKPTVPLDPAPAGLFFGRKEEIEHLHAGMEEAIGGRGRLFTIVGEPGIGKTRLAEQLAADARQRGMRVIVARCIEGEGAPAYWPWVQVIRSYVRDRDPELLATEMVEGAAEIAQVVPEVQQKLLGIVVPRLPQYEGSRFQLFDAVATFLKNAAESRPLAIVLDDLHWADKSSLLLLEFLAREMADSRLLVVGTYRDVEVQRGHPLSEIVAALRRERIYERILLRGLAENEVRLLLAALGGQDVPDGFARAISRETEGNPFFIGEILQHLVEERIIYREGGRWRSRLRPEEMGIPESIRDVIGRRLNRLSGECNELLTVASVIGREFDLAAIRAVSELPAERLQDLLDEAITARVIQEVMRPGARYGFTHALIRETLYEELQTGRRLKLHRMIGEALERLHSQNLEPRLSELSYHFFEAAQGGGDGEKAASYARRAGDRAGAQLAHEEAVAHYDRALQLLELQQPADGRERCNLLLKLGDACWRVGQYERAKEVFGRCAGLARDLEAPELLAEAALGLGGRYAAFEGTTINEELIALLRRALDLLPPGDSALRARVLARLSAALLLTASMDEKRALACEAVEMARRAGDRRALAFVLVNRLVGIAGPDNLDERLAMASESVRLADDIGDAGICRDARYWLLFAQMERGEFSEATVCLRAMIALADKSRESYAVWRTKLCQVIVALAAGRLDDADRLAAEGAEAGQQAEHHMAFQTYAAQTMEVRLQQGRALEFLPTLRTVVEQAPHISAGRYALLWDLALSGAFAEARSLLEPLTKTGFDLPMDLMRLVNHVRAAEAASILEDEPSAEILYDSLLPYAEQFALVTGIFFQGSVSRYLGLLATTLRRWDAAVRHFEYALEAHRRGGLHLWLAWTECNYADMLLRRGNPADRAKAHSLLAEALESAQAGGRKLLLDKALALKMRLEGTASADVKSSIDAVTASVESRGLDFRSHAAPDGTVTLLFSDMEGFSTMTERLGDREAHRLIQIHNDIVRAELTAHGGYEVDFQGDGFLLAFPSASRALDYAISIQKSFASYSAEHAENPIRVRIGLHTGEPIRDADRFFGKTVIIAARVANEARGGEILVSSLVKELTEGGGKFTFDGGQGIELKGLAGEHLVYEVLWDAREPRRKASTQRRTGNAFIREGDFWTITYDGKSVRLRDAKGMHAIVQLLRHPGREFHVADLSAIGEAPVGIGDAGEILDPKARADYQRRLESLREELEEAKRFNDVGRVERLEDEIEFITAELSTAFGLGGRPYKAADVNERIRKAVTSRIRHSVERVQQEHPELGRHFAHAIRTGAFCCYAPENPVEWNL